MELTRQITRTLHDEHMATVALLERLEGALLSRGRGGPPDVKEGGIASLLRELAGAIEGEIKGHFAFEEAELFPRLAAVGDGAIGEILSDEHAVILPLGARVTALARAAAADGFSGESWDEFRRLGAELVERMIVHVQKEEMGLLPALEDVVDGEDDMRLMEIHTGG